MSYPLNKLYAAAGLSKQAVWEHFQREQATLELIRKLIAQVDERRAEHPGEGLEKLYWQLAPEGIGRDKFCRIFGQLGYYVKQSKSSVRTTIPAHKVFKNLIEGRVVEGPCQVWQSDITYIQVGDRFYYLTFIIDVYTRRIVGWAVSDSLRADANIRALKMATGRFSAKELAGCVHHSDRGTQYTDGRYLKLLRKANMPVSMGQKATDNGYAERVNGVIKNEYLIPWEPSNFKALKKMSKQAVNDYNTKRHHGSLGRQTPLAYETNCRHRPRQPRKMEVIRSERTPNFSEASLRESSVDTIKEHPYCTLNFNNEP